MDNLKIGTLLSGARPVGDGINGALRGFAVVDDEEIQVIAKYLPEREILCEIICAKLGRNLDLPIPEPLLLFDDKSTPLFGSVDMGYPNLLHSIDKEGDSYILIDKLKKWVFLESASFFDELIVNADRHKGNLLFDGSEFFLIDHGLSIHDNINPDFPPELWVNQLMSLLINKCNTGSDKSKTCNIANVWVSGLIDNQTIDSSGKQIPTGGKVKESLLDFLSERQNMLLSMINSRIGNEQADFVND